MANTDAEYVLILVGFFAIIGFLTPFFASEFGGAGTTYNVQDVGTKAGLGVLNAISSVLVWTFGVPIWLNLTVFLALRVMMYFILLRNTPFIGTGGS